MICHSTSEALITPAMIRPPPANPVSFRTFIIDIFIKSGLNKPGMCTTKTINNRTKDKARQVAFVYLFKIILTEATIKKVPIKYTQIIPPGINEGT